jgi:glycerol-3-phosphate dehydrogenase
MQRDLVPLATNEFDVVVIGGGICGAAAAWDATQRGLSVALLERDDFGGSTSANSLKVVHGGIRYLQHLDIARVRESSGERSALLRIAPHLVKPMPVLVPAFGHGMQGRAALGAAFTLLNALTWDRNRGLDTAGQAVPRARLVSRSEVLKWCPELESRSLTGGGLFWDGQLHNPPRLVLEFVRTAAQAGAVVANYCEVRDVIRQGNRVVGVTALDRWSHDAFEVRARVVLNAAGPFAEQLYVRAGLQRDRRIPLSRDLALVISRSPSHGLALALPTSHRDPDAFLSRGPRHLFLIPWHDVTLAGVHSAVYRNDPNSLSVTPEEVQLFLAEVNAAAPWLGLTPDDVAMVYAGLLPAGAGDLVRSNMSFGKRSHVIDNAHSDGIEGLVTAVPNRFTTARRVAERAVDLVAHKLARSLPPCRTAATPLLGAAAGGCLEATPQSLAGAVVQAVRHEMAQTLADCVFRRTDIGTSGHPGTAILQSCADLMAIELGWSSRRKQQEQDEVLERFPVRASC